MISIRLGLLALAFSTLLPTLASAQTRTVYDSAGQWILLGGGMPRTFDFQIPANPGETAIITIHHGGDDSGDRGVHWRVIDAQKNVIASGFSDKEGAATWKVRISGNGPRLIIEDKDTEDKKPAPGNGIKVKVDVTK